MVCFKGSQLNWACLTKEAFAIYMFVKKLTYNLEDADVILCSEYLPLWKVLEQNTLNLKVNRWLIEISPFQIEFQYIKEIRNILVDTMSHLISIDPSTEQEPELYGYEFGYYMFDELPPITTTILEIQHETDSERRHPI